MNETLSKAVKYANIQGNPVVLLNPCYNTCLFYTKVISQNNRAQKTNRSPRISHKIFILDHSKSLI